ncbi:MAG: hypothetical protein CMJ78_23745 [Planctomycetaceae bacterium]|nr:hypothetical protein [Planctomycetaceae bacterium]
MSQPSKILDRLVGLETEYAIRFRPDLTGVPQSTDFRLFHTLLRSVKDEVLTVDAKHLKEGVFTANGGALWFERVRYAGGHGLLEGSTPECRGAREAVCYQRAQDRLLTEACMNAAVAGELTLIKNDRDSQDNVYGAQENYELTLSGLLLLYWRVGLVCLLPFMMFGLLGIIGLLIGFLVYFVLAWIIYACLLPFEMKFSSSKRSRLYQFLLGDDATGRIQTGAWLPEWLEEWSNNLTRVALFPIAVGLWALAKVCYRKYIRVLTPFLISRPLMVGAGRVASDGFYLADKAHVTNCIVGYNGLVGDRPLFSIGHFLKTLCLDVWTSPREYFECFNCRQRIQVCIGDSNMAEEAEYLRVGTTLLVLDAVDAGTLKNPPIVKRPIRALRQICEDPSLNQTVRCRGRRELSAIEIQRYYWRSCREMLDAREDVSDEAEDIMARWIDVLDKLEHGEQDELVGRIDWVTKRFLLDARDDDSVNEDESDEKKSRRKIDLKYHQLSTDGYFERLKSTGVVTQLLDEDEVDRAIRTAPANTPATTRGQFIREFSRGPEALTVNWNKIVIGSGLRKKVMRLSEFGRRGKT